MVLFLRQPVNLPLLNANGFELVFGRLFLDLTFLSYLLNYGLGLADGGEIVLKYLLGNFHLPVDVVEALSFAVLKPFQTFDFFLYLRDTDLCNNLLV